MMRRYQIGALALAALCFLPIDDAAAQLIVPGVTVPNDGSCSGFQQIYGEAGDRPTQYGWRCLVNEELDRWEMTYGVSGQPAEVVQCRTYSVECYDDAGHYEGLTCISDTRCVQYGPPAFIAQ